MDKLKVFVSSTCFDLKQIRRDLEAFIENMGYQPVLSDSADISIPPGLSPIEACKWLVKISDIFVLVIGGRYGTTDDEGKSITNIEFDTASEKEMPVYVFVDNEIWTKRDTFQHLKDMVGVGDLAEDKLKKALGDKIEDYRVFDFLDHVSTFKKGVWIYQFNECSDIINSLKNNFSLLFKELLNKGKRAGVSLTHEKITPILSLKWLNNDNNTSDVITIKSIIPLNQEEILAKLKKLRPDEKIVNLIDEKAGEIEKLIEEKSFNELGLSKKPKDIKSFLSSVQEYAREIDSLVKKVTTDFNKFQTFYNLQARAITPRFIVLNSGNCPAKDIVVYLSNGIGVEFLETSMLKDLSVTVPDMPSDAEDLMSLTSNLETIKKMSVTGKSYPMSLSEMYSQNLGMGLLGNYGVGNTFKTSSLTNTSENISVQLEDKQLRINCGDLKHHFQAGITNKSVFMCSFLAGSNETELYYTCYADNLTEPNKGILKVRME